MRSHIFRFFLVAAVACPSAADAFGGLRIEDYLLTAEHDYTLDYQNKKIGFLESSSSNTPFLNEIELRMKIDEFKKDGQTYAVRLRPNGWGEAKDGERVHDATLEYNRARRELLLNRALRDRYMTVIDYLFNKKIVELNEKLMVLYEDRVNVLRQMIGSPDFNGNDLIDAENDIIRLQLDLIDLKNEAVNIRDEIRKNAPDGQITFDSEKIAGIAQMEKIIEKIVPAADDDNIHLLNRRLNSELAEAKLSLERSENRKYLQFVEASYDMEDRDDFEQAFSIRFGVSIPVVNPNRLDVNRRKLAGLRAESDYINSKKSIDDEIAALSRNLKRLIRQYNVLMEKKKNSGAESSYKIFREVEGVSPLILLKLKESMLKTDIAGEKTARRLYVRYVRLLDVSGRLSEKPLKNYLTADWKALEP